MEYIIGNYNFEEYYLTPLNEEKIDFLHNVIRNVDSIYTEEDILSAKAIVENSLEEFAANLQENFFINHAEISFLQTISENKKQHYIKKYVDSACKILDIHKKKINTPISLIKYSAQSLLIEFSTTPEEDDKFIINCIDENNNKYEIVLYTSYEDDSELGDSEIYDVSYGNIEILPVSMFQDPEYICLKPDFFQIGYRDGEIEKEISNDIFTCYNTAEGGIDINMNMFVESDKFYKLSDSEITDMLNIRIKTEIYLDKISNYFYRCTQEDIGRIYEVLYSNSDFYGEQNYEDAKEIFETLLEQGIITVSIILPQ